MGAAMKKDTAREMNYLSAELETLDFPDRPSGIPDTYLKTSNILEWIPWESFSCKRSTKPSAYMPVANRQIETAGRILHYRICKYFNMFSEQIWISN